MNEKPSYIQAPAVCAIFNVSLATLNRWVTRPEVGFPKPIKIGTRRFWREDDVLAWAEARRDAA